jgi:hypothetical protein
LLAFKRVISLDLYVVEAYIGIASVHQINGDFGQYFVFLEKAFLINDSHPNLILLLAEHYIYKGDQEKAQKLAIKGLMEQRKFQQILFYDQAKGGKTKITQDEIKSRLLTVIAQIYHIKVPPRS